MSKKWTEEQKQAAREAYKARTATADVQPLTTESIQKFEKHDETPAPKNEWEERTLGLDYENKIQSMKNAIKILPPNMIINGRHRIENIQAICGFMVTDEMMDEAYKNFSH